MTKKKSGKDAGRTDAKSGKKDSQIGGGDGKASKKGDDSDSRIVTGKVQVIVSGQQMAKILGVTIRAVQQRVTEKGMPRASKDKYDLVAIMAWREERIRAELSKDTRDAERFDKAAADEKEEKAALAKMDRKLRQGELLEKTDVQRGLIEWIIAVKTALTALAIMLSKQLIGVEDEFKISDIVTEEVDRILQRFADGDKLTEAAETVAAEITPRIVEQLGEKKLIAKTKVAVIEKEIVKIMAEVLA